MIQQFNKKQKTNLSKKLLSLSFAMSFFWMSQGYAVAQENIPDDQSNNLELCSSNLVLNGGFESVDDTKGLVNKRNLDALANGNPKWDIFDSLPDGLGGASWFTDDNTSGIEVQYTGVVVSAYEGKHYVELDSHKNRQNGNVTNSVMTQEIDLEPGDYLLEFAYRPRTKKLDDNSISVSLDGEEIHYVDAQAPAEWELIVLPVSVDENGLYDLSFAAAGKENSLGGFIDGIALYQVCPEEPTITEPEVVEPNGENQNRNTKNNIGATQEVPVAAGEFVEGSGCSLSLGASPASASQALAGLLLFLSVPVGYWLRRH